MRKDPSYLSHRGELATLKNFLGGMYHQDVWLDYATHEEVWKWYLENDHINGIEILIDQMDVVLKRTPEEVHEFVHEAIGKAGGLYFNTPPETVSWLKQCRDYMVAGLAKKEKEYAPYRTIKEFFIPNEEEEDHFHFNTIDDFDKKEAWKIYSQRASAETLQTLLVEIDTLLHQPKEKAFSLIHDTLGLRWVPCFKDSKKTFAWLKHCRTHMQSELKQRKKENQRQKAV